MNPEKCLRIPLAAVNRAAWCPERRNEPVATGIPLPAGAAFSEAHFSLGRTGRTPLPIQVTSLDRWPDGSIRWALVDWQCDSDEGAAKDYVLHVGSGPPVPRVTADAASAVLRVSGTPDSVNVDTGRLAVGLALGQPFPFGDISRLGVRLSDRAGSGLFVRYRDRELAFTITRLELVRRGPLRAEIAVEGRPSAAGAPPLLAFARLQVFAGSPVLRVEITTRNARRASHPGGRWVLGDPGSLLLDSAIVRLQPVGGVTAVRGAVEAGQPLADMSAPVELYQESSGGPRWNGPIHKNRSSAVPLRWQGYRLRTSPQQETAGGLRASPILESTTPHGSLFVAMPRFWQRFPSAMTIDAAAIECGLFPRQFPDCHELQGGEQMTAEIILSFGDDGISDTPLAWCYDPIRVCPTPEWCADTGALPGLSPAARDGSGAYLSLVDGALDPTQGLAAMQERADEYGWRNDGDLVADHESAFQPADRPFVSHYNNQYDAIAAFAVHFLRTGDVRWWGLMDRLAAHVRDIDIYHTDQDKAAYAGGMFWHTFHYVDAGTSSHRSYPIGTPGGGPSPEHNYNTGLMLHYFLTGDERSKADAIGLARWVIRMDDGNLTPFRWLASGATGLASASGSPDYQGPGRGSANSILACLVGHRLTGEHAFLEKAEELIARCVHPDEDLDRLALHDVERRWYYTVFLQAIGVYLQAKAEQGDLDEMYHYARASLIHFARWMVEHERPYLEHPEVLEYPTETWAAQDMRKAEALYWAAMQADGADRSRFLDKARFFHDYAVSTLSGMPQRFYCRPMILVLVNGWRRLWFEQELVSGLGRPRTGLSQAPPFRPRRPFTPQKVRAIRRAKVLAACGIVFASLVALALAI